MTPPTPPVFGNFITDSLKIYSFKDNILRGTFSMEIISWDSIIGGTASLEMKIISSDQSDVLDMVIIEDNIAYEANLFISQTVETFDIPLNLVLKRYNRIEIRVWSDGPGSIGNMSISVENNIPKLKPLFINYEAFFGGIDDSEDI